MTDTWRYRPSIVIPTQFSPAAENIGPKKRAFGKYHFPKTWNLCIEICSFATKQKFEHYGWEMHIIGEGNGFAY